MNPTRSLRPTLFLIAAFLLGSTAFLPARAAAAPEPVLAQGLGKPQAPPPDEEEGSWLTVVLVIAAVAAVGGGAIFLYTKLASEGGSRTKKPKVSESANQIGGYELKKLLQQGHTSQVWEVREIVSSRHFAMKVLLPEFAKDPVQKQLLFNEADIGIEMAHPNVIKIIKVFKEASTPCFVMEFFPSGSVRQRIMYKDWEFIRQHAAEILKQTATGLAYMNSNGWLHRDVKPDNILVNSAGEVRLIDFAIAQRIPTGMARWFRKKGKRAGTRSYMSPEAIRCEALDTRSDIYSFGVTCYEIVTFRTPFKAATSDDLLNKALFENPTPPQVWSPDITDQFNKLILRMMAKKKEERPQNFHEVLMELRKIKLFKNANPAPPKDGGALHLHPEALSAIRRPAARPAPKGPDAGPAPKQ
jgi:serine/threonine-protein kinase